MLATAINPQLQLLDGNDRPAAKGIVADSSALTGEYHSVPLDGPGNEMISSYMVSRFPGFQKRSHG